MGHQSLNKFTDFLKGHFDVGSEYYETLSREPTLWEERDPKREEVPERTFVNLSFAIAGFVQMDPRCTLHSSYSITIG